MLSALFLFACQPATHPTVTIIDQGVSVTFQTDERVPSAILSQAGVNLGPNDRILSNGLSISTELPITNSPITLQLRRAHNVTISSPQGKQQILTSAFTVGEALQESGIQLQASDKVDPPVTTPITNSLVTIHY